MSSKSSKSAGADGAPPAKRSSVKSSGRAKAPAPAEPAQGSGPDGSPRTIKKYPNRRLYDTSSSSYITLSDVKQLVMRRAAFVVRDAKSGEDLTRSILLQIILEEEAGGAPMFTEELLSNIIRFYGNAMQGVMGEYLEKNIETFMELQAKLSEQSKGLHPELWARFLSSQSPLMQGVVGSYVEQSKALFAQMQEQLHKQGEQMLASFAIKR